MDILVSTFWALAFPGMFLTGREHGEIIVEAGDDVVDRVQTIVEESLEANRNRSPSSNRPPFSGACSPLVFRESFPVRFYLGQS